MRTGHDGRAKVSLNDPLARMLHEAYLSKMLHSNHDKPFEIPGGPFPTLTYCNTLRTEKTLPKSQLTCPDSFWLEISCNIRARIPSVFYGSESGREFFPPG